MDSAHYLVPLWVVEEWMRRRVPLDAVSLNPAERADYEDQSGGAHRQEDPGARAPRPGAPQETLP